MRNQKNSFYRLIKAFALGDRGTAAIEFAFISPVLVTMILGIADLSTMATQAANMQTAVRAGVQYVLIGGTDADVAEARANAGWTDKPAGGSVDGSKACKCAGADHSCTTLCADGSLPGIFMTITATATIGGDFMSTSKTTTEVAQIR